MEAVKLKHSLEGKISLKMVVDFLLEDNLIDQLKAERILKEKARSKLHPLILAAEYSIADPELETRSLSVTELTRWFAEKVGVDFLSIDSTKIKIEDVAGLIPQAYATRLQILPLEVYDSEICVATAQPFETYWMEEISSVIKKEIKLIMASPTQIESLLDEFFIVQETFKSLSKSNLNKEKQKLLRNGKIDELNLLIERSSGSSSEDKTDAIIQTVDWLIKYAINERATDIHFEYKRGLGVIRFRIDGKLRVVYKLDPDSLSNVTSRIKILANMRIDEKRKPQDGQIVRFMGDGRKVEMRVSAIPAYYGEKIVIRMFDQKVANQNLDFIGFYPKDKQIWDRLINSSQGLILVTGPTGSGKTTTLYTSLNLVATSEVNVCTVEDPIEMTLDTVNQVQVNQAIGVTFVEAAKAFLRQDPDIIMVGEIREKEAAEVAIQASLTGHLVFSTLHTNGALATIQRLIDIGVPAYLIKSSLKAILAQRLVRRLCSHCKVEIPMERRDWLDLKGELNIDMPETMHKAVGCHHCKDTGYAGRICVYELVELNDKLKNVIHDQVDVQTLKKEARGMFTPFRLNCIKKIIAGETSLAEVLKIVY